VLAGIRRVPCVLHAVDDEQARARGAAANLRPGSTERATPRAVDTSADIARPNADFAMWPWRSMFRSPMAG
jgi:hypothetical protein